jgi:hemerythrin-like metal-binding protein
MEKCHYMEYNQHKDAHVIFIDEILHLVEIQQGNKEDAGEELLNFPTNWLKNHILKIDKKWS